MTSRLISFWTLFKREFFRFFTVPHTTIFPVLITVAFYMVIFGVSLGARINEVAGVPYLLFMIPGLFMQMVIQGSYSNPSGSLFVSRNWGNISDQLMSPISHTQFIWAYLLAGIARGIFLGVGSIIIAMIFLRFTIHNFWILLVYTLLVGMLFSLAGIVIGLWSKKWEQLNIFINFVVTPLTFLGGIFYTLDMVPPLVKTITLLNPIYYMVNGSRYGMIGIADSNVYVGLGFLLLFSVILYAIVFRMIKIGYNLKV